MSSGIQHPGYLAFIRALLDGRLRLGETVTQEKLCSILGMSISPLREAMTLLSADGLITMRRRLGVEIIDPDVRFVGNTFQFRELIEVSSLKKFVGNVPKDWVDDMNERHVSLIRDVRSGAEHGVFEERIKALEYAFHGSFVAALANEQITMSYERLMQRMYLLRLLNPISVGPENTVNAMNEHLRIIESIAAVDRAGAVAGLRTHFSNVLRRTLAA